MSETVTFEFPRELVKKFHDTNSPDYWWGLFCDDDFNAKTRLECLLYTRVLEWQESNRDKVTPETPNGTEVEALKYVNDLTGKVLLVGPDPTSPNDYAVIVDEYSVVRIIEWDNLRLVEPLNKESTDE